MRLYLRLAIRPPPTDRDILDLRCANCGLNDKLL